MFTFALCEMFVLCCVQMSRRESVIGRAQSMLEAPVSKQRRSSLQLPFQGFFPSPKLGDGPRNADESAVSSASEQPLHIIYFH